MKFTAFIIATTITMTSCFAADVVKLRTRSTCCTPTLDDTRPQLPSSTSTSTSPSTFHRLRTSSTDDGVSTRTVVRTRSRTRAYTDSPAGVFPFVVPYPDGFDPSKPKVLPVARQFEADGTFADLYIGGDTVSYDADCVRTGSSQAATDSCAAKQGKPVDPRKALAIEYRMKFESKAVRVSGADWFKGKIVVKDPR